MGPIKHILALLALAGAAAAPSMAQQTRMLSAERHNEYGIVYTLPVTALEFEIEAEHTVCKAGPFHRYARKYVGADNVVEADTESWRVKRVRMRPKGIPDTQHSYLMQLKAGATTQVCVGGDGDGMLLAINTDVQLPDYTYWENTPLTASSLATDEWLQYVDEDFLVSQSDAKRAQMLAAALMTVRESKLSLSRGTAETMPTDGRQLELMLLSLEAQEKAMTEAFTGTVQKETVVRRFTYVPDSVGSGQRRDVLCRLSDFAGFTDADDLTGEPVYVQLTYTSEPQMPVDDNGEPKRLPKDAVAYTIPATARVTLTWLGAELMSADTGIAQRGIVFGLEPKLFTDKKAPSMAEFDPATGALLRLTQKK